MMLQRQRGALLLMVSLLLATLAALAFGMNRAGSAELRSIHDDYEGRAAAYLAEAGVAAARWSGQIGDCENRGVAPFLLGAGTVTTRVMKEDEIDVTASGVVGGATRTVVREKIRLYKLTDTESADLSEDMVDTTIVEPSATAQDKLPTLRLGSGQPNQARILMNWDPDEIDDDVLVVSATLTLVPTAAGSIARQVVVHSVTAPWDRSATWIKARPASSWDGGTYSDAVLATASVGAAAVTWDLTGIFDGWASKRIALNGVLLRLLDDGQAVEFHSREAATASRRPVLRLVRAKKC